MNNLVLIDTSAWIAAIARRGYPAVKQAVHRCLELGTVAICGPVLIELLQGTRRTGEYQFLSERLSALPFLDLTRDQWYHLSQHGFSLRRAGIVVPTIDIIVAGIALAHDCFLLHCDHHFELIARVLPLRTVRL